MEAVLHRLQAGDAPSVAVRDAVRAVALPRPLSAPVVDTSAQLESAAVISSHCVKTAQWEHIRNVDSNVIHVFPASLRTEPQALWASACGWRFTRLGVAAFLAGSEIPEDANVCAKCIKRRAGA